MTAKVKTGGATAPPVFRSGTHEQEHPIMPQEPVRTARIEARVTPEALAIIKRRSISDFVVDAAQKAAYRAIDETNAIRLSVEDQRIVIEDILNPPEPTPGLHRAILRYSELIREL